MDVNRLCAEEPDLRKREHQARAVICLVAQDKDCVLTAARAALALDPGAEASKNLLRVGGRLEDDPSPSRRPGPLR